MQILNLLKLDGCKNVAKLSIRKVGKDILCRYSMSKIWSFDGIENKHDVYRGEDFMKKFFESLGQHVMEIFNFEK